MDPHFWFILKCLNLAVKQWESGVCLSLFRVFSPLQVGLGPLSVVSSQGGLGHLMVVYILYIELLFIFIFSANQLYPLTLTSRHIIRCCLIFFISSKSWSNIGCIEQKTLSGPLLIITMNYPWTVTISILIEHKHPPSWLSLYIVSISLYTVYIHPWISL